MKKTLPLLVSVLFALLFVAPVQAQEKFEPSTSKLFIAYLDLQVDEDNRTEYYAYAITDACKGCEVLYLLIQKFKGETRVWNSFRCDVKFKILKTSSNGLYDIQCKTRVLGGEPPVSTKTYSYNGNDYVTK